jgi:ferredoxin
MRITLHDRVPGSSVGKQAVGQRCPHRAGLGSDERLEYASPSPQRAGDSVALPFDLGSHAWIGGSVDLIRFERDALRANLIMPKVTVLPANVSAEVEAGELLLEAGEKAGVEMEAGCFNCSCGTCVVEVVSGMENLSEPTPEELDVLDAWNKDPDKYRLTCCVKVDKGDVVIKAGH